jgi:hypothetical protein
LFNFRLAGGQFMGLVHRQADLQHQQCCSPVSGTGLRIGTDLKLTGGRGKVWFVEVNLLSMAGVAARHFVISGLQEHPEAE